MKKFLLALDGSEHCLPTVEYAANVLPRTNSEVILYHVHSRIPELYWDMEPKSGYDFWMSKLQKFEEEHLRTIKDLLEKSRQVLLSADFYENHVFVKLEDRKVGVARDISAEAKRGYHTLVMGRLGAGEVKGLSLGSVANKVLSSLSETNLCIVAGRPETQKLMIALDGSVNSMRSVDAVCFLKRVRGTNRKILLFHAMRRMGYPAFGAGKFDPLKALEDQMYQENEQSISAVFAEAKSRLIQAGYSENDISTKIVKGVPSRPRAILGEAIGQNIGSIFVGRQGITQTEEYQIGRIPHKLISLAENTAIWITS
jgi:nucleotide-binding universal stress UspA family protein